MPVYHHRSDKLTIQPYSHLNKWDVIISIVVIGIMVYAYLFSEWSLDLVIAILIVGVVMLLQVFVVQLLVFRRVKIVFDKRSREVYKDYGGLFKRRLYGFSEAAIIKTDTAGGAYFGISNKKNRYGKNQVLIDPGATNAELLQFENEILPEIERILKE